MIWVKFALSSLECKFVAGKIDGAESQRAQMPQRLNIAGELTVDFSFPN